MGKPSLLPRQQEPAKLTAQLAQHVLRAGEAQAALFLAAGGVRKGRAAGWHEW